MASNDFWTDPAGTRHEYTIKGSGLKEGAQRAVERQKVWSSIDPNFDNSKWQVSDDGRIVENKTGFPWWEAAAVLGGPLAVGLLGGGAAAGAANGPATQAGGVTGGILPGTEAGLGASLGGGGGVGGFLGNLYDDIGGLKGILGITGTALGANANASANNRGAQFAAGLDLERVLMQRDRDLFDQQVRREQEGRASGSDAWRKLVSGNYVTNRPPMPNVTPYAAPQRDLSGLQPGAAALQAEAMKRLQGGNPLAPVQQRPLSLDPNLLKPGALEQITGYVSPWLTLLGR